MYTRHVSGCIVVANTSNPASITKAAQWKEQFDKMTKVKDEPSIPCTLFINHDKIESVAEEDPFDNLRAENSSLISENRIARKESETYEEPSALMGTRSSIKSNN